MIQLVYIYLRICDSVTGTILWYFKSTQGHADKYVHVHAAKLTNSIAEVIFLLIMENKCFSDKLWY